MCFKTWDKGPVEERDDREKKGPKTEDPRITENKRPIL